MNKVRNQENLTINDLDFEIVRLEDLLAGNEYKAEDIIICAKNEVRIEINNKVKSDKYKYRVTKKHRVDDKQFYNGDILILD